MPVTPNNAAPRRFAAPELAAETNNPQLKERLFELSKHWNVLALELEGTIELLDEWGPKKLT